MALLIQTLCPNCAKTCAYKPTQFLCPSCQYRFSRPLENLYPIWAGDIRSRIPEITHEIYQQIEQKNFEETAFLIRKLIDQNAGLDADFRQIGLKLIDHHKDALGLLCCDIAAQKNPHDAANHYALARCFEQLNMFNKAKEHIDTACAIQPDQPLYEELRGSILDHIGLYNEAARSYLRAIAIRNIPTKYFEDIANEPVDPQLIEQYAQSLLQQYPNTSAIFTALGILFSNKLIFPKADEYFRKSLELNPNQPLILNKLADVKLKQNQPELALELYKKSLAIEPANIETLRSIGRLYKDKSQWLEALQYFEKIHQLDKKDNNAVYEIKEIYRKLNNPHKAIQVMKDYQITDPSYFNWAMHHIFEILYYDLKDDQQLVNLVEQTYSGTVNESFVYDYYGYSLMNLGRLEEAVRSFERLLELEPKNARVMRELGRIFCDLQRYQQAVDILTKSFAIENKNSYGFYYLALAYHRLGKDDLARKTLNEGKQFDPNYKWFDDLLSEIDPNVNLTDSSSGESGKHTSSAGVLGEATTDTLPGFLLDLTELARNKKIDDIIGRENEMQEIIEVLCRRSKANPLIVGQPGVGKTMLINGLAYRIARGDVPDALKNYRLLELEVFAVVAGTRYVGTLEQKFLQLQQYCQSHPVIIFIDELHTLMGAGSYSSHETGGLDEMFKPLLTRPNFKLIGATTDEEYQKNIARSGAFDRRFTRITIFETSKDDTLKILSYQRPKLEQFFNVSIPERLLRTIYDLSDQYIKNRYMPDKACDILERSCIKASLSHTADQKTPIAVEPVHVVQSIAQVTRIPESNIHLDALSGMMSLEDRLRSRVIGQEEAITKVTEVVRMTKSGLDVNPDRPDGVFLFVGPTGVGKTELAKALAEALEGSDKKLVRIDMSEYNDSYALSKLIGTAPGYVGYHDEGRLTKAIREDPSAVILLDEIEKAHPKIYEVFLQVFDDGRLTDGKGQIISFCHTTIIMTSNLGSDTIYGKMKMGFSSPDSDLNTEIRENIFSALRRHFSPEFLNRIDEIIVFRALDLETLKKIAWQKIQLIVHRFEQKDIRLNVDESVVDLIVQDLDYRREGARGVNRALEEKLSRPLSRVMIQNPHCHVFNVHSRDNQIVVFRGT